jgi:PIN domain nuclease of toxin-antitoxin system
MKEYLIDTHILLWFVTDDPRLSKKAKKIYCAEASRLYISIASVWEMAIKISLQKLSVKMPLARFIEEHVLGNAIEILSLSLVHVTHVEKLPFHHRDPFDRLIVSQALIEKVPIISIDTTLDQYGVKRVW